MNNVHLQEHRHHELSSSPSQFCVVHSLFYVPHPCHTVSLVLFLSVPSSSPGFVCTCRHLCNQCSLLFPPVYIPPSCLSFFVLTFCHLDVKVGCLCFVILYPMSEFYVMSRCIIMYVLCSLLCDVCLTLLFLFFSCLSFVTWMWSLCQAPLHPAWLLINS